MATRSLTITGPGSTGSLHLGRGETVHTLTVTNNTGFGGSVGGFTNATSSTNSPASGTSYVITPSSSGVYSATLTWTDSNKAAQSHVTSGTAYSGTLSASPTNNIAGNDVTMSWTMSPTGSPTYNSSTNAFSPSSGSTGSSGTSGSFALTTVGDSSDGIRTNRTVTLRTPGGTSIAACVIRTVSNINIYSTPSTPSDITFSGVTETQITATAVAGTNDYGTLQVRLGTVGTWLNSPQTYTGLTSGTSYTFQARQVNVSAISGTRQETQSTSQAIDETPNAFPFTDVISAYKSATQTSNQITVAGLGTGVNASVSITGGTYSKNGGGYTSAATTAANGDTFTVRHTSSSGNYGLVTTSLTIGTVTEDYTSRTIDTDITFALTHNGGDITALGLYNSSNGGITVGISGGRNNTNYRGVVTAASSSPSGTATLNTGIGNGTPSSTTVNLSIGESAFEFSSIDGDQVSYKIQARTVTSLGGSGTGSWVDTGDSFTLTHTVTTPSGFTVTQGAVNASSTPITLTANGTATPTDCVKEFRLTTAGAFGSTSTTNQNWGTTVTYATRFRNSTTGQTSLFGNEITRFVGDPAVSISGSALQYNSIESFTHTRAISGTVANTSFRIKNTQATQGNSAGAVAVSGTATGTTLNLNLTSPTDIPTAGNTVDYTTEFRVTTANNGDGVWRSLPSGITAQNFTIGRQSTFAYTDTTNQNLNVQQDDFVEINGLVTTVTASHSGAGSFAVSNSSTTPSSGFSTANKSVTSTNRFVHARHTSANTLSTNTDTTITIDGISDTFRSTTAASLPADVTITINFTDGIASQNEPSFLLVTSDRAGQGTGQTGSSTNPIPLDFGDVVQFTYSSNSTIFTTCDVAGFDSGEWTNIGSITNLDPGDNEQKIRPSSGITVGEQDQVVISCDGDVPNSRNFYFVQRYNEGDATVSFPTTVQMAENDTDYSLTISARGDATNQSNTVYEIRDGNSSSTLRGSRTGAGSITVTTGFPQFLGIGVDKFVYYRLPTASGGDNVSRSVVNDDGDGKFTLFRGSSPGANDPTKTGYGIAIFDDGGDLVTSFQESHTVLRTIFSGTATTSTTAPIDIETSISGLSANNSVIMVTGNANASGGGSEYPLNIPTRFNGTKVRVARWTTATSIKVTVMQYSGGTLTGTAPSYGAKIFNEDGNLVLDNLASSYAVKEVININPSNPGGLGGTSIAIYTGFSQSTVNYAYITLAAGRYPTSGGLPIPALACTTGNAALIAPRVAGVVSGSYRYVYCTLPANVSTSNFKLAMLVERANTTPSYYGGSASAYGLRFKDGSGNIQFDSSWRQAIVQNVITCNQFAGGTGIVSQNGSYDVETGSDGVEEPLIQGGSTFAEFTQATYSTGQTKTLTGLNSIDPTNTYLLGGFPQGGVKYYAQPWYLDGVEQETVGGGTHVPAISITGNTTCVISMYRTGGGPGPPSESDYGERVATSSHPQGVFILARIT